VLSPSLAPALQEEPPAHSLPFADQNHLSGNDVAQGLWLRKNLHLHVDNPEFKLISSAVSFSRDHWTPKERDLLPEGFGVRIRPKGKSDTYKMFLCNENGRMLQFKVSASEESASE
jgi:hypothetical protein